MRTYSSNASISVYFAALAYASIVSAICIQKHLSFGYGDFDLAIHTQSIWNITHWSMDCSILGIPFLGNHMVLILYLLAPFFATFPSPVFLLILQSLVLGAGAIGIYKAARLDLSIRAAMLFAGAYLIYPPLILMNLYEFHPVALASTFLIFAILEFRRMNFARYMTWLILAMLCQENIALIVAGFGVLAATYRRNARWIYIPLALGIVYFSVTVCFIMPALNRGVISFLSLYSSFGSTPAEVITAMANRPFHTLAVMLSGQKLLFLSSLLIPIAFLCLFAPRTLIPLLPILAQRLLSGRESENTVMFHYQAEFIPFIFLASISGFKRILSFQNKYATLSARTALVSAPLIALLSSGLSGHMLNAIQTNRDDTRMLEYKRETVKSLTPSAKIACTFDFLPMLACRKEIHSLHHIYTGYHTLSSIPYPCPTNLDAVIMDTTDRLTFSKSGFWAPLNYTNLQVFPTFGLQASKTYGSLTLLTKETSPGFQYFSIMPEQADAYSGETPATGIIKTAQIKAKDPQSCVLELTWYNQRVYNCDMDMQVIITSASDRLYKGVLSPGQRINPPQSWPAGRLIRTAHVISFPDSVTNCGPLQVDIILKPYGVCSYATKYSFVCPVIADTPNSREQE